MALSALHKPYKILFSMSGLQFVKEMQNQLSWVYKKCLPFFDYFFSFVLLGLVHVAYGDGGKGDVSEVSIERAEADYYRA